MIQRFEHGGNVYQPLPKGKAWLDFSANINPLGLSPAVRQALAAHANGHAVDWVWQRLSVIQENS